MWVRKVIRLTRLPIKESVLFWLILNSDNRAIIFLSLLQVPQCSFRFLLTESFSTKGIYIGIPPQHRQS